MSAVDTFVLGQQPHRMTVVLSPGTDFAALLQRDDGVDWPVGTAVELVVGNRPAWAAVVAGPLVTFGISEMDVDAAIATSPAAAKLYYVNGATRLLWAAGPVVVR